MARRLAPHRLTLCASPAYLKMRGQPRTPEDLRKHECLVFAHTSLRTQWSFEGPDGSVKVPIKGKFLADSGEALRAAAVAGVGIILQPAELLAEDIQTGLLTRILKRYEPTPRPLHVLYAPDRRMTQKLRSFLDFASYAFGENNVTR